VSRWGFGVFMPHAPAIWAAGFHTSVVNARAELTWDQSGLLVRFAVITKMSGGWLCYLHYSFWDVRLSSVRLTSSCERRQGITVLAASMLRFGCLVCHF